MFYFLDPNWQFLGSMRSSKAVLGSTLVVEQLSFSMISLILTLDFDLMFSSFLTFCGPNVVVLGLRLDSNTA